MVTLFALAAALMFGSADFLGGTASRRAPTMLVVAVSTVFGAVVLIGVAMLVGGHVAAAGLGWAAAAGVCGALGLMVFYQGLAVCPMTVVAPVSALVSTVLPVGVALALGERPGPAVYAGAVLCVAAVGLVSAQAPAPEHHSGAGQAGTVQAGTVQAVRALLYGTGAGVAFGLFFLFLRNAGESGVFWPAAAARVTGTVVVCVIAACQVVPSRWRGTGRGPMLTAIAAGTSDALANACYIAATRAGLFGVAVVLTSLYPGITVLLARIVHGERMRLVQRMGLLLAAAGVILVTA